MVDWPGDYPYRGDGHGPCPWCGTTVRFVAERDAIRSGSLPAGLTIEDRSGEGRYLHANAARCPQCHRVVISMMLLHGSMVHPYSIGPVYPRCAARPPIPEDVPKHVAEDYNEAALVLADSPKASAALSRRCLQNLLTEEGYTSRDLADQIQEVLDARVLSSHVAKDVDAVRQIGMFAAHPKKSKNTGEIVDVEPGEAEWNLDVLDALFDHFYVQPAESAARRAALDAKLNEVGKPPMKQPPEKP